MKLSSLLNLFKKNKNQTNNISDINELKISGCDSKALLKMGIDILKTKNYSVSIQLFTKAIELDPTNISAYLERSKARRAINDTKASDSDYRIASKMIDDLDNGLNAHDLANKYYDSGDYENAIKYFFPSRVSRRRLCVKITNIFHV